MGGLQWYPHYLGDYARDTRQLSLIEHGAYRLLMDYYYSNGRLPTGTPDGRPHGTPDGRPDGDTCGKPDHGRLYRLCGAVCKDEFDAIDYVLETFFKYVDGCYINQKIEEVIKKQTVIYNKKVAASEASRVKRGKKKPSGTPDGRANVKPHGTPDGKPHGIPDGTQNQNQNHNISLSNDKEYICAFERFWDAYDYKKSRCSAEKAFNKAIKLVDIETLLKAVEEYKAYCKATDTPKKYPQGWLNDKRWLDDNTIKENFSNVKKGNQNQIEDFIKGATNGHDYREPSERDFFDNADDMETKLIQ